jgi:hypothetical protein
MASLELLSEVYAVVTPDDRDNLALLTAAGVRWVEHANAPLGAKHNAGLVPSDRYMVLPSDDLISVEWAALYREFGGDYVSPDRCGVYEMSTGRCKVLTNRPTGRRTFGAGRIFSRAVVDALGGKVWSDHRQSGLDTDSHARIVAAGFDGYVHRCEAVPITDLKSDVNLWDFDTFSGLKSTAQDVLHMAPWVASHRSTSPTP